MASVTGANADDGWWKGTDTNKSTKYIVEDGKTLTIYTSTTNSNIGLVIEGMSSSSGKYATINPHDNATTGAWGEAITSWGTSDSRTSLPYTAMSLKITIERSGSQLVLKVYKK